MSKVTEALNNVNKMGDTVSLNIEDWEVIKQALTHQSEMKKDKLKELLDDIQEVTAKIYWLDEDNFKQSDTEKYAQEINDLVIAVEELQDKEEAKWKIIL